MPTQSSSKMCAHGARCNRQGRGCKFQHPGGVKPQRKKRGAEKANRTGSRSSGSTKADTGRNEKKDARRYINCFSAADCDNWDCPYRHPRSYFVKKKAAQKAAEKEAAESARAMADRHRRRKAAAAVIQAWRRRQLEYRMARSMAAAIVQQVFRQSKAFVAWQHRTQVERLCAAWQSQVGQYLFVPPPPPAYTVPQFETGHVITHSTIETLETTVFEKFEQLVTDTKVEVDKTVLGNDHDTAAVGDSADHSPVAPPRKLPAKFSLESTAAKTFFLKAFRRVTQHKGSNLVPTLGRKFHQLVVDAVSARRIKALKKAEEGQQLLQIQKEVSEGTVTLEAAQRQWGVTRTDALANFVDEKIRAKARSAARQARKTAERAATKSRPTEKATSTTEATAQIATQQRCLALVLRSDKWDLLLAELCSALPTNHQASVSDEACVTPVVTPTKTLPTRTVISKLTPSKSVLRAMQRECDQSVRRCKGGEQGENLMVRMLLDAGVPRSAFCTEAELKAENVTAQRRKQKRPHKRTPDVLFKSPVMLNGTKCMWIDSKKGLIAPDLTRRSMVRSFQSQINDYCDLFGPGVVVWHGPYLASVDNTLAKPTMVSHFVLVQRKQKRASTVTKKNPDSKSARRKVNAKNKGRTTKRSVKRPQQTKNTLKKGQAKRSHGVKPMPLCLPAA